MVKIERIKLIEVCRDKVQISSTFREKIFYKVYKEFIFLFSIQNKTDLKYRLDSCGQKFS